MRSWGTEFKQFLLRGNVVDLAVGIVIGAAFAAVVQAAVTDLLTPLIAAIFGQPDFNDLSFTVNGSVFRYGHFLNVLIAFVTIALVVFFFVVKPAHGAGQPPRVPRPHHPQVPRMRLRDPDRCSSLPVLHLRGRAGVAGLTGLTAAQY